MATFPSCTHTRPNDDSALSTTANVISILTFAYVLLVGLLYQLAIHRGTKYSCSELRKDAEKLRQDLKELCSENRELSITENNLYRIAVVEHDQNVFELLKKLERAEKAEKALGKWAVIRREVFRTNPQLKAQQLALKDELTRYHMKLGIYRRSIALVTRTALEMNNAYGQEGAQQRQRASRIGSSAANVPVGRDQPGTAEEV